MNIGKHLPEWRNWQTRWTQNPVGFTPRVGSTPTSGTPGVEFFSLTKPPVRSTQKGDKNVADSNHYTFDYSLVGWH